MNQNPPPIIDSAKLILFAVNDKDVEYTDRIDLHVGTVENGLIRIGEMPNLAITKTFYDGNYLLIYLPGHFCIRKNDWKKCTRLAGVQAVILAMPKATCSKKC
jgi:hypothetical protein